MNVMQKRVQYLDTAKGIGIILVCVGHAITNAEHESDVSLVELLEFIAQFHMPLFFFVSGNLFHNEYSEVPLVKDTIPQLTLTRYCRKQLLDKYKEALSTSPLKMATVLLYFFGTRIANRQSRFVCPRDRKTRGNPKGGNAPLWHTDFACKV